MNLFSYLRARTFGPARGSQGDIQSDPDLVSLADQFSRWFAVCSNSSCPRRRPFRSRYVRRSQGLYAEESWFCGPGCAQEFLLYRVRALLSQFRYAEPRAFRVPLGMVLVNRGVIARQDVLAALNQQQLEPQKRFGEFLLSRGLVTEHQLAAALSQQWACPFYPLESQPVEFLPFAIAPLEIFRASDSVPAYLSSDSRSLHVSFCYRIDHTTLFALESMLDCRTYPSVALASAVGHALDSQAALAPRESVSFETVRDPRDVTAILTSYAAELRASRIRVVRTERHLWARFTLKRSVRDVLFQLPPRAPQRAAEPHSKDPGTSADSRIDGVSAERGIS